MIPFNSPYISGGELDCIETAIAHRKLSGDGPFTKRCQDFFTHTYGFKKSLLTSSCTAAFEMAALLLRIQPGDEIIMPSYAYVSTANTFLMKGAKLVFADSRRDAPGLDEDGIEALVTDKTKAIVPVHYGGVACNMEKLMAIANRHGLFVIEDAAQAIDSYYTFRNGTKKALGSIGHLGCFSFHDTKNIMAGEGGLLAVNDSRFIQRAGVIWDKGTNRSDFLNGATDYYEWVDVGASFMPSELNAACLWGQLQQKDKIKKQRLKIWQHYDDALETWARRHQFQMPALPQYADHNAHTFYLVGQDITQREKLLNHLKENGIKAVSHYRSLHKSPFFKSKHDGRTLKNADRYTDGLLRLPLYVDLAEEDVQEIIKRVKAFYS